jgi:hypothetical protein
MSPAGKWRLERWSDLPYWEIPGEKTAHIAIILFVFVFHSRPVLEFLNNLWGLGTE